MGTKFEKSVFSLLVKQTYQWKGEKLMFLMKKLTLMRVTFYFFTIICKLEEKQLRHLKYDTKYLKLNF